jgi:hypothetical protein
MRKDIEALCMENLRLKLKVDAIDKDEKGIRDIARALDVSTAFPHQMVDYCLSAIEQLKKSGGLSLGMVNRINQLAAIADALREDVAAKEARCK